MLMLELYSILFIFLERRKRLLVLNLIGKLNELEEIGKVLYNNCINAF